MGDYLGELTDELDDDDCITTFVSGGPKNYSYQTKNGKTVCKVRGFTLLVVKTTVDLKTSTLQPSVLKSATQMGNQCT